MKRLLFVLLVLTMVTPGAFAQLIKEPASFIECPAVMVYDTIYTRTSSTVTIWFNSKSDSTEKIYNSGSVDLDIYTAMADTLTGETDTLTVTAYGLKLKKRETNVNALGRGIVEKVRSDVVAVATLPVDSTFHTYYFEGLFDDFAMFDGVDVVFTKGGGDLDSVKTWTNAKVNK